MSPEARKGAGARPSARLDRAPGGARVAAGGREEALARLVARAEARALERGRREGEARALEGAAAALEGAAARLDEAREAAREGLAHTAIDLALDIVRALLRVELPAGRYDLEGMVREALAFSGVDRGRCTVHLNPADHAALDGARFRTGTVLEADSSVGRGSVHVTTPQGVLVRDVDEALRSISERLHGEVR